INGETTLSFLAAPWGSDGTDLTLSVSGNATIEPSEFTMTAQKWTKFTTTITGEGTVSITFTPSKRLFLDQVAAVPAGDVNAIVLNTVTNKPADNRIYSIDGRYVGNNFNLLGKGIYIINGKKIVK
ncbi:MAG: peptidase, partial [Prevotella sp.]|nr:peptidase [Prevotella sp.]